MLKDYDEFPDTKNTGLMMCYCVKATSMWLPWTLINKNFNEFSDLNPDMEQDETNYCWDFQRGQFLKSSTLFLVSTSAVFINEFVADFYQ